MSTPTRPCPYCGAAVLTQAAHCGTCGRPMPPGPQPPPPSGSHRATPAPPPGGANGGAKPNPKPASKTVFGLGIPQLPPQEPAGQQPAAPQQAQAPAAPAAPSVAPPQGPPAGGFGSTVFGQPAAQMPPGAGGGPPQPFGGGPAAQVPTGQATPDPAPPAVQSGLPAANPQPPAPNFPASTPAPQPMSPGAAPAQPHAASERAGTEVDPLERVAGRLPQSEAGTLFGVPLSTLRDQELERKVLRIVSVALAVAVFVPMAFSPTMMRWDAGVFRGMIFPLLTAAVYALVGFAPKEIVKKVPPAAMQWGPFAMSFLSIGILGLLPLRGAGGGMTAMGWGYAVLVFGLLNRLHNPADPWARYIVGGGGALAGISGLTFAFSGFGSFELGFWWGLLNLLTPLVVLLCLACVAFAFDPKKVPQLRSVDAFAPLVTAILLAWLPLQAILLGLAVERYVFILHMLVGIAAYFGVLMLTAPEAYDEARRLIAANQKSAGASGQAQPPPGAFPPQGPPAQMPQHQGQPPASDSDPPQ